MVKLIGPPGFIIYAYGCPKINVYLTQSILIDSRWIKHIGQILCKGSNSQFVFKKFRFQTNIFGDVYTHISYQLIKQVTEIDSAGGRLYWLRKQIPV